jgi:hypothetical protein
MRFYTHSFNQFSKMSPPTTPTRAVQHKEADTVKKPRFYQAYDSQTRGEESLQSLATKHGITKRTASNWLKQR